ncbi:hypothetical protein SD10_00955 [Spirosoma radiotolerans]|uniref:Uncharacterized protein n=1 Tax=Spirosoma radiotolerans TaxID=1379870 RepID=A0A0E3ZT32_9BACT|nr:hypothetical protein SD10_00955 [Spirosoma radiotolerans]
MSVIFDWTISGVSNPADGRGADGLPDCRAGRYSEGDTVVVVGAGPVSLMVARVIVTDHVDYRLEFAHKSSFAEAYNFRITS